MSLYETNAFRANLQEIRFALSMWNSQGLLQQYGHPNETQDDVLEQASRFATEVLYPASVAGDREGSRLEGGKVILPSAYLPAYQNYCAAGWPGLNKSRFEIGSALPTLLTTAVTEIFNTANMALTMGFMPVGGALTLFERYGTPEQKATYIPKLSSGAWLATMAMTEPQAGTDLGAIKTRAFSKEGRTTLIGEKSLITFGDHQLTDNIVHLVLARSPDGPPGTKGLSLYVVAKFHPHDGQRNDVDCIGIEKKMGLRGSPTATLVFGSNGGAEAELLGAENRGLEHMFVLMNRARLNVAVFGLASAEAARQAASCYAVQRIQGRDGQQRPVPIIYYPDVRRMIVSMTARTETARYLAYYAASLLDQNNLASSQSQECARRLEIVTPIAKAWCTESGFEVATTGVQIHGGIGYLDESDACRYFREARAHTIYEGATAVHANDLIFRKILRDGGEAISAFFSEMRDSAQQGSRAKDIELMRASTALVDALARCEKLVQWTQTQDGLDPLRMQANGSHFLMMVGACVGAWLNILAAMIAVRNEEHWPDQLIRRKIRHARFFMQQVVAPALAMTEAITEGANSVLDAIDDFDTQPCGIEQQH